MALRSLTFVCANGHEYEELRSFASMDAIPAEHEGVCKCNAKAAAFNISPGKAPAITGQSQRSRRGGGITEGEARQAKMQFGVTPTSREELNSLLRRHGKVAVSDGEFSQLMEHSDAVVAQKKKDPYTAEQKKTRRDMAIQHIKDRRQFFRSAYDNGAIPKPQVDTETAQAAVAVQSDPLIN